MFTAQHSKWSRSMTTPAFNTHELLCHPRTRIHPFVCGLLTPSAPLLPHNAASAGEAPRYYTRDLSHAGQAQFLKKQNETKHSHHQYALGDRLVNMTWEGLTTAPSGEALMSYPDTTFPSSMPAFLPRPRPWARPPRC